MRIRTADLQNMQIQALDLCGRLESFTYPVNLLTPAANVMDHLRQINNILCDMHAQEQAKEERL